MIQTYEEARSTILSLFDMFPKGFGRTRLRDDYHQRDSYHVSFNYKDIEYPELRIDVTQLPKPSKRRYDIQPYVVTNHGTIYNALPLPHQAEPVDVQMSILNYWECWASTAYAHYARANNIDALVFPCPLTSQLTDMRLSVLMKACDDEDNRRKERK